MKNSLFLVGIVSASCLMVKDVNAATLNRYSNLYVFGDSLSDTGNIPSLTGLDFPPSSFGYFDGRFSNGPVWVEYLADLLGLPLTPYGDLQPGTVPTTGVNYATGGATTTDENTLSLTFNFLPGLPGLEQQVDAFIQPLLAAGQRADQDALYVFWFGANDYLPTDGTFQPFTSVDQPLANIQKALNDLAQVGVKNILLPNLPDLGQIPRVAVNPTEAARITSLVQAHNDGLKALSISPELNLIRLDVDRLFQEVLNPQSSPFTNTTFPCQFALVSNPNPAICNEFAFWDTQHPTTAAHQLLGQFAYNTLQAQTPETVPEPASVLGLGLFALGTVAAGLYPKKAA